MMSKRISNLSESPCYQCGMQKECEQRVKGKSVLQTIIDSVFGNANFDYHDCGLWIAMEVDRRMKDGEMPIGE